MDSYSAQPLFILFRCVQSQTGLADAVSFYILVDLTVGERPGTNYGKEIHFQFLITYFIFFPL